MKNEVDLGALVKKAREHRKETGDDKTLATAKEMRALLLAPGIRIINHFRQSAGSDLFRLDVVYRGESFVRVQKNRFSIPTTY